MAKYDLEQIYRSIKARAKRASPNTMHSSVAELTAERARNFRDNPNEENLKLFKEAEIVCSEYANYHVFFWRDFEDALLTGDYCVNRSFIKNSTSRYDPEIGFIYLAVSNNKPGQIKIGATTTSINKRISSLKLKYSYYHCVAIYCKKVDFPARIERLTQEKLKKYRVSGNIQGDSNEWYEISESYCKRVMTEIIKSETVKNLSQYSRIIH